MTTQEQIKKYYHIYLCVVAIILFCIFCAFCRIAQAAPQKSVVSVSARNLNQEVKLDGHTYHAIEVRSRLSGGEEQCDVQILHDIDCLKKDLKDGS